MAGRIVIIGLDGATWRLLDRYIDEGIMPNLAAIRDSGTSGVLESTVPPSSIPAWPSMVTGKNPGKHGIVDFTFGPGHVTDSTPVYEHGPWHLYDDRTMAFVNVPGTYGLVEHGFDGYVVSGLFTPADDWETPDTFAYPEPFAEEIEDMVSDYHIDLWGREDHNLLDRAELLVDHRTTLLTHLLDDKDVDLLWGVYIAPDRLQHKFWAYQDENHPLYDPEADDRLKTALQDHFAQLDDALGEIRERLDDEDTLIVVSDHGFQPMYRSVDISTVLQQGGHTTFTETQPSLLVRLGLTRHRLYSLFAKLGGERVLDHLSKSGRQHLKRIYQAVPKRDTGQELDEEQSRVTFMNSGHGIRINTASRGGPVPDGEKAAVMDEVVATIQDFMDAEDLTGYVKKRAAFLSGPHVADGPDVAWFFDDVGPKGTEEAGKTITSFDNIADVGTGANNAWHHPDGIYCITGPGIEQGEQDASIYDVLPTVTYLLGGRVPADADGAVMDVLADDHPRAGQTPEQVPVSGDVDGVDI